MAKQGQLETTFTTVLGKQPGNVGVSGEVGGEKIVDKEDLSGGGKNNLQTPFDLVFNKKG